MVLALPPPPPLPPSSVVRPAVAETTRADVVHEATPVSIAADILEAPSLTPGQLISEAESIGAHVYSLRVSAEVPETRVLASGGWGRAEVAAGTRMSVTMSGSTVTVRAQPGLQINPRFFPNIEVDQVQYNVETGKFDVEASGWGPDFIYERVATWIANDYFTDLIPAGLKTGGATTATDAQALERAMSTLSSFGGAGDSDGVAALPLVSPAGSATLYFREEVTQPLDDGMVLIIPARSTVYASASFNGTPDAPRLEDLTLSTQRGVVIRKAEGFAAGLQGIELRRVRVRPGLEIEAEYDLLLEQAAEGGIALLRLFAAAAGAASGDSSAIEGLTAPMPDVRFESTRAIVDAKIEDELRPQLIELVRANDGAIEGVSLMDLLGVAPLPPSLGAATPDLAP